MDFHKLNENKLINIKNCSKNKDIPKNMKDFVICMKVFLTDSARFFCFAKKRKVLEGELKVFSTLEVG